MRRVGRPRTMGRMTEPPVSAVVREALRLYQRYAVEVVEAFGFCPYAERARIEGRVTVEVSLDAGLDVERALEVVERIGRETSFEIGILLYPLSRADRVTFEHFVSRLREASAAKGPVVMALADFHPTAELDLTRPERLTPFVRRTPHPTVQLVRRTALDHVRRKEGHGTGFVDLASLDLTKLMEQPVPEPLHTRIAAANHERVMQEQARITAVMADIFGDRDRCLG